jgi:hypothetical protein
MHVQGGAAAVSVSVVVVVEVERRWGARRAPTTDDRRPTTDDRLKEGRESGRAAAVAPSTDCHGRCSGNEGQRPVGVIESNQIESEWWGTRRSTDHVFYPQHSTHRRTNSLTTHIVVTPYIPIAKNVHDALPPADLLVWVCEFFSSNRGFPGPSWRVVHVVHAVAVVAVEEYTHMAMWWQAHCVQGCGLFRPRRPGC